MIRHAWTKRELAFLRRHYGRLPSVEIARRLRLPSVGHVHRAAVRLGLSKTVRHLRAKDQRQLARLVKTGACNACIGRKLGFGRMTVRLWRRRLGLPEIRSRGPVKACRRCMERTRATTQRQLERLGLRSMGELRPWAFRQYARKHGWPDDLPPRAVQILDALAANGPMTRIQIAEAIGMAWHGARSSLKTHRRHAGGSYLALLMRRGLVLTMGRAHRTGGRGNNTYVYTLAMTAERTGAP